MGFKNILLLVTLSSSFMASNVNSQDLPTTYEYFQDGGIQSGLTGDTPGFFKLNGKDLRIISGAIHYFRIHPQYWRDRLKKLRAIGANTVETYVPWNLHEPEKDVFDFGDGDRDFSSFLNVTRFIETAQEEDLLVLFRPGPYICSEWDFGGLPSWLQRDPNMQVRTSYQPYLDRVKIYFDRLLPQVSHLQFTKGGSIIAIQLENEYGYFNPIHKEYLEHIKTVYEDNGFGESLFFTSDGVTSSGTIGTLEGLLMTANFQSNPESQLSRLLELQPNRPVMVMEYWSGWFDHWFENHHTLNPDQFEQVLETIFSTFNGSVNFYMFHGGTNFGFMAGANSLGDAPYFTADVTSYDYDAPLSEAGDYNEKYNRALRLISTYQVPALHKPDLLPETTKIAYPNITLQSYLTYGDIIARVPSSSKFEIETPISMELLPMNNDSGQSYGYIVYRKRFNDLQNGTKLKVGPVKDFGTLLIDGQIQPVPTGESKNSRYWLNDEVEFDLSLDSTQNYLIDVLVENMARVNVGHARDFLQQKGLPNGNISVNGVNAVGFQAIALEFKSSWVKSLSNWRPVTGGPISAPVLFQSTLTITGQPADTFLDMSTWHKGIVFVNGFNLGRYFKPGPQQTLFVPAPLLQTGNNSIIVFEQLEPGTQLNFVSQPILDVNQGEVRRKKK